MRGAGAGDARARRATLPLGRLDRAPRTPTTRPTSCAHAGRAARHGRGRARRSQRLCPPMRSSPTAPATSAAGCTASIATRAAHAGRTQLAPTSGAMGYGVPAAVAAALLAAAAQRRQLRRRRRLPDERPGAGDRDRRTARQRLISIVVDNGSYGTIRMHQEREYPGRVSGSDLGNPDFAALARAYGWRGETRRRGPPSSSRRFARRAGAGRADADAPAARCRRDHQPHHAAAIRAAAESAPPAAAEEGVERIDCLVVGAGVVGLAVARALAAAGREVVVSRRAAGIGTGTSRNSEVIHAGIYYAPGSLKARLCVRGPARCSMRTARRAASRTGAAASSIVATTRRRSRRCARSRRRRAPTASTTCAGSTRRRGDARSSRRCAASAALLVAVDRHRRQPRAACSRCQGDAEDAGGALACARRWSMRGRVAGDGIVLRRRRRRAARRSARHARQRRRPACAGDRARDRRPPPAACAARALAKGNYFALAGRSPFSRLIYPVPEPGGLGVHLTLDLAGQARFGPDVEWLDATPERSTTRSTRARRRVLRRHPPLLAGAAATRLLPDYSGVRPKLSGPGAPARDFMIAGPAERTASPGLVQPVRHRVAGIDRVAGDRGGAAQGRRQRLSESGRLRTRASISAIET